MADLPALDAAYEYARVVLLSLDSEGEAQYTVVYIRTVADGTIQLSGAEGADSQDSIDQATLPFV